MFTALSDFNFGTKEEGSVLWRFPRATEIHFIQMLENGQTNAEHVQQRHSVNSIRMEQGFPEGFSFVASSNQRESNVSE